MAVESQCFFIAHQIAAVANGDFQGSGLETVGDRVGLDEFEAGDVGDDFFVAPNQRDADLGDFRLAAMFTLHLGDDGNGDFLEQRTAVIVFGAADKMKAVGPFGQQDVHVGAGAGGGLRVGLPGVT